MEGQKLEGKKRKQMKDMTRKERKDLWTEKDVFGAVQSVT